MAKPRVIYESRTGDGIEIDRTFYDRLANQTGMERPVDQFIVPSRSGRAWPVRAGQTCRIMVV